MVAACKHIGASPTVLARLGVTELVCGRFTPGASSMIRVPSYQEAYATDLLGSLWRETGKWPEVSRAWGLLHPESAGLGTCAVTPADAESALTAQLWQMIVAQYLLHAVRAEVRYLEIISPERGAFRLSCSDPTGRLVAIWCGATRWCTPCSATRRPCA